MWWALRILTLAGLIYGVNADVAWLIWASVIVGLPFWFTSSVKM